MEMNGRSTVSYLVRTPRVPFFMLISIGLEAQARGDVGSLPLYVGTFARSYSVLICGYGSQDHNLKCCKTLRFSPAWSNGNWAWIGGALQVLGAFVLRLGA